MITPRQSEISTWLTCRRKAHLRYERGWTLNETESNIRGVGTYFHGLAAEYYDPTHKSDDLRSWEFHPDDVDRATLMFETYVEEVEQEGYDVGQSTVFVERRLESSPFGDTIITAKLDHLYMSAEYGLVGRDHKTSGSFFNTAPNDFQLLTNAVILHDNGLEVNKMEHNIVKNNGRTSRAKPPWVQRNLIDITVEQVDSHRRQLAHMVSEWRPFVGVTDATHPGLYAVGQKSCVWANGGCEFANGVCEMVDDGSDYQAALEAEYSREEAPRDPS